MIEIDYNLPRVDLPHQAGVLGTAWMDTGKRALMLTRLKPGDFVGVDRELAERLWEAGDDYTYLTVESSLSDNARKRVAEVQATLDKPNTRDFMLWLSAIEKAAMTRAVVGTLQHAITTIKPDTNPQEAITAIVTGLLAVSQRDSVNTKDVSEAVDKAKATVELWRAGEKYHDSVPTGFSNIDRRLGGMKRGHICTIAARPGRGKTQLALQVARNVALLACGQKRDAGVIIFSAEMTDEELLIRLAQCSSGISAQWLREGERPPVKKNAPFIKMKSEDYDAFQAELDRLKEQLHGRVIIDDTAAPSTEYMYQVVAAHAVLFKDGVDLVVFDYIELAGNSSGKNDNETVRVGRIMRGLKKVAKDHKCAVIALSQLSREIDKRADKFGDLPDLRQSGEIEALSNQVLFIDYPDSYRKKSALWNGYGNEQLKKRAEGYEKLGGNVAIYIAKNRNGRARVGPVLKFTPHITRFSEAEKPDGIQMIKDKERSA
jgi:replicative DNA helicase